MASSSVMHFVTFLIILLIYGVTAALGMSDTVENCTNRLPQALGYHDNRVCYQNRQWYLYRNMSNWHFAKEQILLSNFPVDRETRNYVRQVKNALFSVVYPTQLSRNPKLAATSEGVLTDILDLHPDVASSSMFLQFTGGNHVISDVKPLAHRYGGHQFGYWSGQLGDGRAVMLGEYVNSLGDRWELQLKGSGLTPYSRRGDGRAVIRSSVREFLCSEAMNALGIATSRAASLVVSEDPVIRDQFYNGNVKAEQAAVVLRLAKSWFRIGSLEILTTNNETALLKRLVDFIIVNYFPSINSTDSNRFVSFFQEVVRQTADMIGHWQSVGFTHGVCNTDNFSILSLTIDYGPFGFMEEYNPKFVPNTSDDEGRYSYENQPQVGYFNLDKLCEALLPLFNKRQEKLARTVLKGYSDRYKSTFMELFLKKFGLSKIYEHLEEDEQMVALLLKIMEDTRADFTMTFRELSEIPLSVLLKCVEKKENSISDKYWTLQILANHEWFKNWVLMYSKRLSVEGLSDIERQVKMQLINPRYVLRNWIAQSAILRAEQKDFSEVNNILKVLRQPYKYHSEAEIKGFAAKPPNWAKNLKEEKQLVKSGKKDIVNRFSSSLGKLTCAEIKISLERLNVKYTRNQNNKADLLLLLSDELKNKGMDEAELVDSFNYK